MSSQPQENETSSTGSVSSSRLASILQQRTPSSSEYYSARELEWTLMQQLFLHTFEKETENQNVLWDHVWWTEFSEFRDPMNYFTWTTPDGNTIKKPYDLVGFAEKCPIVVPTENGEILIEADHPDRFRRIEIELRDIEMRRTPYLWGLSDKPLFRVEHKPMAKPLMSWIDSTRLEVLPGSSTSTPGTTSTSTPASKAPSSSSTNRGSSVLDNGRKPFFGLRGEMRGSS